MRGNGVPIEEWPSELVVCGKVNPAKQEKPKRKRVQIGQFKSHALDPKPSDLTSSRMKSHESVMEVRTI